MRSLLNTRRSELRESRKALAFAQIGEVSDRELLLLGVALYWAEGAKDKPYERRELITFVNSDPGMIKLFLRWLDLIGIEEARRQYRVSIHESADVAAAEEYWRKVVRVPGADFRKTTLKRHNPKTVRKRVGEDYRGCLTIKVLQPSAVYQWVDGWWRGILAARGVDAVPE
jgi:hypothetical protein